MIEDFETLPNKDETVVGNRGINLSGGQKARLGVARALYSDADLYLFDDPISALDIKVGRELIEKGIMDMLAEKTVILTTHALAFLPYFDRIIMLDAGYVKFDGDYQEYLKSGCQVELKAVEELVENEAKEKNIQETKRIKSLLVDLDEIAKARRSSLGNNSIPEGMNDTTTETDDGSDSTKSQRRNSLSAKRIVEEIITLENRSVGSIDRSIISEYIKMVGICRIFTVLLLMTCWCLMTYLYTWFLQYWSATNRGRDDTEMFMIYCMAIIIGTMIFLNLRSIIFLRGSILISRELNMRMLSSMTHA